jgi:multiple sugar transport system substrate-binding protein
LTYKRSSPVDKTIQKAYLRMLNTPEISVARRSAAVWTSGRIMSRVLICIVHVGLLLSTGCTSLEQYLYTPTAPPFTSPTPAPPASTPDETSVPNETPAAPPATQPRILRIWLPSRFDPNGTTSAANILRQRLADFESEHPGLEVEVRTKSDENELDIVNGLSVTSLAAPSALPDLIALSRPALELASLKGLLHPIDGLSVALSDPNWYEYARQLGQIQNTGYGLPFAGDALILAYHSEVERIGSWNDILASENPLVFTAGDPKAMVALSLYVSANGELVSAQGQPTLNQEALTRVLTLISDGVLAGVFSPSLGNMVSDEQVLQAYLGDRANMAIFWASHYRPPEGQFTLPLQGLDDTPFSFGTGWVWSLTGSNADNQQLAVELADYLVDDDFLKNWTNASGYLPTRPSSVDPEDTTMMAVLESAQLIPSNDALLVLGPLMRDAVIRVLSGEKPETVAESVITQLP